MKPDHYEKYLSYRLKRLYLLRNQVIDEELKAHGLARSQWLILFHVNRTGDLAQKDLQRMMRVESATLTRIVDSLVKKGWLERTPSATDKRVKILSLTGDGRARWKKIPDPLDIVEKKMLRGMDASTKKLLRDGFERMIQNLEPVE